MCGSHVTSQIAALVGPVATETTWEWFLSSVDSHMLLEKPTVPKYLHAQWALFVSSTCRQSTASY